MNADERRQEVLTAESAEIRPAEDGRPVLFSGMQEFLTFAVTGAAPPHGAASALTALCAFHSSFNLP
jgi:hypothetical protein